MRLGFSDVGILERTQQLVLYHALRFIYTYLTSLQYDASTQWKDEVGKKYRSEDIKPKAGGFGRA